MLEESRDLHAGEVALSSHEVNVSAGGVCYFLNPLGSQFHALLNHLKNNLKSLDRSETGLCHSHPPTACLSSGDPHRGKCRVQEGVDRSIHSNCHVVLFWQIILLILFSIHDASRSSIVMAICLWSLSRLSFLLWQSPRHRSLGEPS